MKLFNFKKNKNKTYSESIKECRVKVLGSGCAKCNLLEKNVIEALKILGQSTEIQHITDFAKIASYGVMSTPALVVDEKVISYGRVLTIDEVVNLLKNIM